MVFARESGKYMCQGAICIAGVDSAQAFCPGAEYLHVAEAVLLGISHICPHRLQRTVAFQLSPTKTPQDILDFDLFSSPNITDLTYIYTLAIFHTVYMPLQLLSSCKVLKYESFSTLESSFFRGTKSQDEVL